MIFVFLYLQWNGSFFRFQMYGQEINKKHTFSFFRFSATDYGNWYWVTDLPDVGKQ